VVARTEARLLWRDPAVWITTVALAVALGAAWFNARAWSTGQAARIEVLLAEEATRLADMQQRMDKEREGLLKEGKPLSPVLFGSRHGTTIGHYSGGRWMVLPVTPLAPLALGELDLQPLGHLASVDRWMGQARAEPSSPLWQRFPRFDVVFALAYLLPLALIVTCAGVVSAEREAGTLRLRASQGGVVAHLGFCRVLTRGGLLTLVAIGAIVACVVTTTGQGAVSWSSLALWIVACVAYVVFWLSLIVWIDSWGQSTGVNLLACAGCWLVLLFVAPGVVRVAADWTRPVSSRASFEQARREAYQETWGKLTNAEVLKAFYEARPDISPERDEPGGLERYGIYQMRLLEIMRETLLPMEAQFDQRASAYRQLVSDLRFVSPLLLLHDLSTSAAGTSAAKLEDFLAQRDAFLNEWDAFYVERIYQRVPIEDLSQTPIFTYREPALAIGSAATLASLAGLLLPACLLAWFARRGYRRLMV
jgi:ABC-2 type transport system permease protein